MKMKNGSIAFTLISWIFGVAVLTVGVFNLYLVHPIPGVAYLLLSLIFFPPTNGYLAKKFGFSIPMVLKIGLAIVMIQFTFGVSDLGDMIDKLYKET
jgi:hypothetical protein